MHRTALLVAGGMVIAAAAYGDFSGLFQGGLDHPAIQYESRPVKDPVAELNRKIRDGKVHLNYDGARGYLRSVLDALNVPIESQMAVFSKTSFQSVRINPRNPRTLFFNDSVSVGWVRGGPVVELAAEDPQQGVIFYTLDQRQTKMPQFTRNDECLRCHESYSSLGVPGTLLGSVVTAIDGTALYQLGSSISDDRSPMEQRWGGWYVTGRSSVQHMGNRMVHDGAKHDAARAEPDLTGAAVTFESLKGKFDTDAYLSPYSDIAALMVFEHQMHVTNLLTRVGWEVRAAQYPEAKNGLFDSGPGSRRNPAAIAQDAARELADALLFINEAPLPGKIEGTSGFAEKFAARGPRDSKGRGLRQLDLDRRLTLYPCSYMIYTEAFDELPAEARDASYRRMWQILSGEERNAGAEKGERYARLSLADRQAIVEILRETKNGLPDYFQPVSH